MGEPATTEPTLAEILAEVRQLRAENHEIREVIRRGLRIQERSPDRALTVQEVARQYRRRVEAVRELCVAGILPCEEERMPSGRTRYRISPEAARKCRQLSSHPRADRAANRRALRA